MGMLYRAVPKSRQAMSEKPRTKSFYMLQGGVEIEGSIGAFPADLKEDNEIGGKTGTTDNASMDGTWVYKRFGYRCMGWRRRTQHHFG